MRLDLLCEGLQESSTLEVIYEDEGAPAPSEGSVPGVITTSDVAMHPAYLGFTYRGGAIHMKSRKKRKKRKSLHEETLNKSLASLLDSYSEKIRSNNQISILNES